MPTDKCYHKPRSIEMQRRWSRTAQNMLTGNCSHMSSHTIVSKLLNKSKNTVCLDTDLHN